MKKQYLLLSSVALAALLCHKPVTAGNQPTGPAAELAVAGNTLQVNTTASTMKWNAKKVGGEHYGTIKLANGTLDVKGTKLAGGTFTIDMSSIVVEDITRPESNKRLTDHLKSDDFFGIEEHPNATFTITKATPVSKAKAGEPNYSITGNLTIKGITHPITFPATITISGKSAVAAANIVVDRTKYDIKYRSGLVGTAADKIIDDTFTIDLQLQAGETTNSQAGSK